MEPLGITCKCGRFVPFKPCLSNANGNKGRLVAVCNGPNSQGENCRTIRWQASSMSPSPSPPLAMPSPSFTAASQTLEVAGSFLPAVQTSTGSIFATSAPPGTPHCLIRGCGQSRLAPDCQRRLCRKHCISSGGCGSKTHTGALPSSAPLHLVTAAQPSSIRLSSPPSTISPLMTSVDASWLQLPSPPMMTAIPVQMSPDPRSLDARPNARFSSHMPAIFTDQWKREQEMEVERKRSESEKKVHAMQVKHTVTVYAWSEDSKPADIQDFQEGPFTWPYFPLSPLVLSALSLAGPEMRIQLYRKSLGTWVTISIGHVIELQEGARVFLKASHVNNYVDFDKLLNLEAKCAPHLRYNLTGERRELRERYKKVALGKAKVPRTLEITLSEDEDANKGIDDHPPPSQRHFRKQTFPASLFQPSASSTTSKAVAINHGDIIDVSSDDASSTPQRKRKGSSQASLLAHKRRNASRSHTTSDSTSVIELSDDSDCPLPSSSAVAIKQEFDAESHHDKQWPAEFYAVDIVNFFADCESHPDIQIKTLFHRHFPKSPYRRSTFNENRKRWLMASQPIRDSLLRAKYTDDGKWSVFQKKTRKTSKI